jgi:hypothetical protein
MLWILSINVHFVVQRPSGHHFKAAIFNLDGEKTRSDIVGRYAGSSFANTAGIGINSFKDTVPWLECGKALPKAARQSFPIKSLAPSVGAPIR